MQKLIERMLTICSRFTKNYRTSNIINLFTKTVYRFSVTFHIKLLQMSRKTTQCLRIRQNCSSRIFLNISFINTNQSVHQSRILCDILIQRKLIFFCSTIQKFLENLWTKSKTQNSPANTRSRRITTTNIIIHVESSHIIRIVSQRRSFRSNSNHVFRSITTSFFNKFLNKRFISQSFKRSTRFWHKNKNSFRNIKFLTNRSSIVRVNIWNKISLHFERTILFSPVFQSKIHSTRPQIRTTNTNLTNSSIFFTFFVQNFTRVNIVSKITDTLYFIQIKFTLVHTISHNIFTKLTTSKLMQNHTFFTSIDDFSVQQFLIFFNKLLFFRKFSKSFQNLLINLFCSIIISQISAHWNRILCNSISSLCTTQFLSHRNHTFQRQQLFPRSKFVCVSPSNHFINLSNNSRNQSSKEHFLQL